MSVQMNLLLRQAVKAAAANLTLALHLEEVYNRETSLRTRTTVASTQPRRQTFNENPGQENLGQGSPVDQGVEQEILGDGELGLDESVMPPDLEYRHPGGPQGDPVEGFRQTVPQGSQIRVRPPGDIKSLLNDYNQRHRPTRGGPQQ